MLVHQRVSVAGKQGSCNSKLFFLPLQRMPPAAAGSCIFADASNALYTLMPNGETTYTLESSVSSLTIQNTINSTRSSNTTGEKKKDKWRTSTLRGWLPFAAKKRGHASFGTYHKITETGGSWDSHSFFLRILVAFKCSPNINRASTITPCPEYPRVFQWVFQWVSNGYPMCIQCVSNGYPFPCLPRIAEDLPHVLRAQGGHRSPRPAAETGHRRLAPAADLAPERVTPGLRQGGCPMGGGWVGSEVALNKV